MSKAITWDKAVKKFEEFSLESPEKTIFLFNNIFLGFCIDKFFIYDTLRDKRWA